MNEQGNLKEIFFDASNKVKEQRFSLCLNQNFVHVNRFLAEMLHYYYPEKSSLINTIYGRNIREILPEDWVERLNTIYLDAIESHSESFLIGIYQYKRHTINYIKIAYPQYENNVLTHILIVTRYLNIFNIDGENIILSPRELDILVHIVFGFSVKSIEKNLHISASTINTHLCRIREKLDVNSQEELVKLVSEHAIGKHLLDYLQKYLDPH